jgi:hypothetical protein
MTTWSRGRSSPAVADSAASASSACRRRVTSSGSGASRSYGRASRSGNSSTRRADVSPSHARNSSKSASACCGFATTITIGPHRARERGEHRRLRAVADAEHQRARFGHAAAEAIELDRLVDDGQQRRKVHAPPGRRIFAHNTTGG